MVPMKVRDKNVRGKRPVAEFALQLLAEHAEPRAAIEDINSLAHPHFDTGGIPSIAHVLGLWGRRGTAYAPELNPHRLVSAPGPNRLVFLVSSDAGWSASIAAMVHPLFSQPIRAIRRLLRDRGQRGVRTR